MSMANQPSPPIPGFRGGGGNRFLREVQKPKDAKKAIARLLVFFKGQTLILILLFVMVLISSATAMLSPYLIGRAIDLLNQSAPVNMVITAAAILASVYLCDALSRFAQTWIVAGLSQHVVKAMRQSLFAHLQTLPIQFFDSYTHGELMSRLSNDTDNIAGILGSAITQFISTILVLCGTFSMMLWLSPVMTAFSIVSLPLVFLLSKTISSHTRKLFKEQQAELGRLNARIEEDITGMAILKAYSREKYSIASFAETNEKLCKVSTDANIWSGYIMPIMNVINNLSFAIVAGTGGVMASMGLITPGLISAFINYSRQFGRPLNELAGTYNQLQSALASAERIIEIIDQSPEIPDAPDASELTNLVGKVEFRGISFGYNTDNPVLKNVSFTVRPGQTAALVGPTGAGKTTIVNLIARFYDSVSGEILLDGKPLTAYTRSSLRKMFGIVLQDTYLFTGTIMENICYGQTGVMPEMAIAAAKAAGAHSFIKRLPDGYQTVITENSNTLSQGQRQLLAIVRAMLSNPSIMILDEATSSVDTRTELKIQEAMAELMKGLTSFVIAHRLSTITGADLIMVVRDGMLAEYGSHAELMEQKGVYWRMYMMQANGINIDEINRTTPETHGHSPI